MKILGSLGIDWKMFLIQALNFLILFLILKWLFFKHFVAALKKEKVKAEEIQKGKDLIEKQKLTLQETKEKEMSEAKKRAREIIKEAENMAKEIKKRVREETEQEKQAVIKQIKSRLSEIESAEKSKPR